MRVRDLYLTTDVTGALGLDLPITIKTTIGKFEPGFTDWSYVSESGWENYYDWPNKLADVGPFDTGGLQSGHRLRPGGPPRVQRLPRLHDVRPERRPSVRFRLGDLPGSGDRRLSAMASWVSRPSTPASSAT